MTRQEGFNDVVRSRILAGNYFLLKRCGQVFLSRFAFLSFALSISLLVVFYTHCFHVYENTAHCVCEYYTHIYHIQ